MDLKHHVCVYEVNHSKLNKTIYAFEECQSQFKEFVSKFEEYDFKFEDFVLTFLYSMNSIFLPWKFGLKIWLDAWWSNVRGGGG